jgi:hypothetical protein
MSFLDIHFHIACVDVISYIDVKVAAESGGKDLNLDFLGGREVMVSS